jgi:L-threonylcarbamoyladenylate synthase
MDLEDFQNDLDRSLEVMEGGGLILYPTDTIWGIGCDATNNHAVGKVFNLKGRDLTKSFIILVASIDDIFSYTRHPHPRAIEYIQEATLPVTVVYEGAYGLPGNLVAHDGTIAIRWVKEVFCNTLSAKLGKPLVSTSANKSGNPAPGCFKEVSKDIIKGVDYAVRYRRDETRFAALSSVVRFSPEGKLIILRS